MFLCEASALDLQAVFDSGKYRRFAWLGPQQQLTASLGGRMLH
jgi:hypothetical protein